MQKKEIKNIDDLINGKIEDSVEFIYQVLKSDSYYTEERGSLITLAQQTLQVISMLAKHDERNPIITKFNDKVFFKAGSDVIKDNGLFIGTIKYSAHFVTAKTKDEYHRTLDESKARHLALLFDCIHNPQQRIEEESDGKKKIYYAKRYKLQEKGKEKENTFVSLFFVEIDMDGHIRYITIMPADILPFLKEKGFLHTTHILTNYVSVCGRCPRLSNFDFWTWLSSFYFLILNSKVFC